MRETVRTKMFGKFCCFSDNQGAQLREKAGGLKGGLGRELFNDRYYLIDQPSPAQ